MTVAGLIGLAFLCFVVLLTVWGIMKYQRRGPSPLISTNLVPNPSFETNNEAWLTWNIDDDLKENV